jgi:hypothetical protein
MKFENMDFFDAYTTYFLQCHFENEIQLSSNGTGRNRKA